MSIITSKGQYDFSGQDVDVAIVFARQHPAKLPAQKLFDEEVFPVCSPAFLAENGSIQSHKKLAELPLLKLGSDAGQGGA